MNETGTRDRMITSGSRGEEKGTANGGGPGKVSATHEERVVGGPRWPVVWGGPGKDPRPSEREDGRMGRMTAVWYHRVTRGSFVS